VWAPYRKCFSNPDVTVAAQNLILWKSEISNLLGIQSCCPIVQIGFQQGFINMTKTSQNVHICTVQSMCDISR
jgi:hypothetical protein